MRVHQKAAFLWLALWRILPRTGSRTANPLQALNQGRQSLSGTRVQASALARSEDGATLIELAFMLPLLFIFFFCFMEMCLAFYTHDLISECAREGTRYAIVRGASCVTAPGGASCTTTTTAIQNYVTALPLPNLAGGKMTVVASYPDGSNVIGDRVKVVVTYAFKITMPYVPSSALSMTSTSEMYIIQ